MIEKLKKDYQVAILKASRTFGSCKWQEGLVKTS